jgi:hypothetical protein
MASQSNHHSSHSLSGGAKTGIAIGVILGLLLVAIGVLYMCFRRQKKSITHRYVDQVADQPRSKKETVTDSVRRGTFRKLYIMERQAFECTIREC